MEPSEKERERKARKDKGKATPAALTKEEQPQKSATTVARKATEKPTAGHKVADKPRLPTPKPNPTRGSPKARARKARKAKQVQKGYAP